MFPQDHIVHTAFKHSQTQKEQLKGFLKMCTFLSRTIHCQQWAMKFLTCPDMYSAQWGLSIMLQHHAQKNSLNECPTVDVAISQFTFHTFQTTYSIVQLCQIHCNLKDPLLHHTILLQFENSNFFFKLLSLSTNCSIQLIFFENQGRSLIPVLRFLDPMAITWAPIEIMF